MSFFLISRGPQAFLASDDAVELSGDTGLKESPRANVRTSEPGSADIGSPDSVDSVQYEGDALSDGDRQSSEVTSHDEGLLTSVSRGRGMELTFADAEDYRESNKRRKEKRTNVTNLK